MINKFYLNVLKFSPFLVLQAVLAFSVLSCASNAASAEEYFSIGMAYYELGKFTEAERWLQRAAAADKTMVASEYNLGRIAFETGRYEDASVYFESVLKKDPNNVIALKAAAYTGIKRGNLSQAESFYDRVLALTPESSDDGYNYALVLYAMEKYGDCLNVLQKYPYALDEKPDALLLYARAQAAADRVEAADSFAKWLNMGNAENPGVLYEYARVLEKAELYALALEQYRAARSALNYDTGDLQRNRIQFDIARILLTADPGNPEGTDELNAAVNEGFNDAKALEELLLDDRMDEEQRDEIRNILGNMTSETDS